MLYVPPERLIRSLTDSGFSIERLAMLTGTSVRTIYRAASGETEDVKVGLYFALYALWETVVKGGEGNDADKQ